MSARGNAALFPTDGEIDYGWYGNMRYGTMRQKIEASSAVASVNLAKPLPANARVVHTQLHNDGAVTLATAVRFGLGISDNPAIFGLSGTDMTDGANHPIWENVNPGMIFANPVASEAVTNTTTETAFTFTGIAEPSIAANQLRPGDVIRIRYQGIATSTNSTDTLTVRAKVGGTTVSTQAANDVANNDVWVGTIDVIVREVGASGTMVAQMIASADADAQGSPAVADSLASTSLDTTAAVEVSVTAEWSVASASNSCRLDVLTVEHLRPVHPFTTSETTLAVSAVSAAGVQAGTLATAAGGGVDVEIGFLEIVNEIPD